MELALGIIVMLFIILLRVIAIWYCMKKARELRRNINVWAAFGFLAPLLAIICVQFMKPKGLSF